MHEEHEERISNLSWLAAREKETNDACMLQIHVYVELLYTCHACSKHWLYSDHSQRAIGKLNKKCDMQFFVSRYIIVE